jgi:hypothetical protein
MPTSRAQELILGGMNWLQLVVMEVVYVFLNSNGCSSAEGNTAARAIVYFLRFKYRWLPGEFKKNIDSLLILVSRVLILT